MEGVPARKDTAMSDEPVCVQVRFPNEHYAQEFIEWMTLGGQYLFIDSLYRRDYPDMQCSWDDERRVINVQVVPNEADAELS